MPALPVGSGPGPGLEAAGGSGGVVPPLPPLPPLAAPERAGWWRDRVMFPVMLAVLACGFLGWGVVAYPLSFVLPARAGRRLGRRVIGAGFRGLLWLMERAGLVELDLGGLAPLRCARGLVVAPNHLSMIDVMLVVSCLPDAACIMKAGLERNPALGGGRLAGYIPNGAPRWVIGRAVEALREGGNLLVFPEGTRSADGRLGAFHPGFALIARRAGAPVQAVLIESNTRYMGKGWPIWRRPAFPLRYRARLGERAVVETGAAVFAEGLRRRHAAALGVELGMGAAAGAGGPEAEGP